MKTENTRPLAERITQEPITAKHLPRPGKVVITAEQSALIDQIRREAMETARETGRTPRQLADERAELVASLAALLAYDTEGADAPAPETREAELYAQARAILAKTSTY